MAVTVVDGDTIKIDGVTYRLNGIDAPEHGQKCKKPSGKTWPFGKRATTALGDMVAGSDIRCEGSQADGYGRTIATCYKAGIDLNRQMVLEGWAWAFLKYSQVYAEEQKAAQSAGIGIWQAKTQTP
ncbi:MAG: thermonuclease family protein [Cohaesibacter sp.]|nr:thermonuclease family protein [Cohaesibacter sp.]